MNSPADDINCEVAEISKKISDHADEIYKTWKHCGLAPAEIVDCYNKEIASDIFVTHLQSSATNHQNSTEGLQRLVSSFVIKDKARNRAEHYVDSGKKGLNQSSNFLPEFNRNHNEVSNAKTKTTTMTTKTPTTLQKPLQIIQSKDNACVGRSLLFQQPYQNHQNQLHRGAEINCEIRRTSDLPIDYLKDTLFDCSFRDELDIKIKKETTKTESQILVNNTEFLQENSSLKKRKDGAHSKYYDTSDITANMKENLLVSTDIRNYSDPSLYSNTYNIVKKDSDSNRPIFFESTHKNKLTEENIMEIIPAASSPMSAPAPAKLRPKYKHLDNANGQDKHTAGRSILTRGSVAERVLMFEKCPDVKNSFRNIKRPLEPATQNIFKVKIHSDPQEHTTLQRELRSSGKSVYIPRFYFPHGKPQPTIAMEKTLRGILSAFDAFPNNQVTKDELPRILKICGLPYYWRIPVLICTQQSQQSGLVERQRFVEFWKQMSVYCHDAASRFVYIMSRGQRYRSYILPEDLAPLIQDVVDTHPGLSFLKEAVEFHSRYVHTVIARIFYAVNRSWSGKITVSELRKSDLLEIITLLEEEDDINQIMAFFSYEHFYVIYCKFWELDRDHDLLISQDDLARHSDHALSTRIIERIFSGCVTRIDKQKNVAPEDVNMSYTDFVWFILSEEDKRSPTAIEYWFRCMDLDGDGILSMYELEYFYEEQQQRMESIGIETLPYEDCLCQMLDMIKPNQPDCITLGDLKKCRMTHVFFDTFFNLEKYLDHEQRDPFAIQRDEYMTDWDRFAAQEYELLISEESSE